MWHASIAVVVSVLGVLRTPRDAHPPREARRAMQRAGEALLAGVGAGETFVHMPRAVMHVRRALSDAELAGLDPAWLAIPAVDLA